MSITDIIKHDRIPILSFIETALFNGCNKVIFLLSEWLSFSGQEQKRITKEAPLPHDTIKLVAEMTQAVHRGHIKRQEDVVEKMSRGLT